jgi:toxin HigB-1
MIAALLAFNARRYTLHFVIRSFRCPETENIYQFRRSRKLPPEIQPTALRKLKMLNNATSIDDLRSPPANRLERLSANRAGQWSIRINSQWRICFVWRDGDSYDVEIVDDH